MEFKKVEGMRNPMVFSVLLSGDTFENFTTFVEALVGVIDGLVWEGLDLNQPKSDIWVMSFGKFSVAVKEVGHGRAIAVFPVCDFLEPREVLAWVVNRLDDQRGLFATLTEEEVEAALYV